MDSNPNPTSYDFLSQVFGSRKSHQVLEIEILSPENIPFIRDGNCIGITKRALAEAFIIARSKFAQVLIQRTRDNECAHESFQSSDKSSELVVVTAIILLFDCENVTACNWRKQFISLCIEGNSTGSPSHTAEELLHRETTLTESFLCSPLHRHTKSPTLWQHRLWIMTKLLALRRSEVNLCRLSDDFFHRLVIDELDVVRKSGQLHPRNYYAFSYMRQLHVLMARNASLSDSGFYEGIQKDISKSLLLDLAVTMAEPMVDWCLSHPSDISGWTFLFYLFSVEHIPKGSLSNLDGRLSKSIMWAIARTTQFAVHIARWQGESLWTFVHLMVTEFGVDILPNTNDRELELKEGLPPFAHWQTTKALVESIYK